MNDLTLHHQIFHLTMRVMEFNRKQTSADFLGPCGAIDPSFWVEKLQYRCIVFLMYAKSSHEGFY